MNRTSPQQFCAATALLFCIAGTASAADFPAIKEIEKQSAARGFSQPQVQLLTKVKGQGAERVADAFVKEFASDSAGIRLTGEYKKEVSKKRTLLIGKDWMLEVHGDGSKLRYRDIASMDEKMKAGAPVASRIPDSELESLGRKFIETRLAKHVALGANEKMVPYFTEFAVSGSGSTTEGAKPDEELVHGATVVFTRTVQDVPVVGPGSKVAVIFANDRTPVGFDLDWPTYKSAARAQKVLPLAEIKQRAKSLGGVDLEAANLKIERLACGLFDAGATAHNPDAVVQTACMFQTSRRVIADKEANAKSPDSGHLLTAALSFIPAGVNVEPAPGWNEAMKARGERPTQEPPPKEGPKQPAAR